jgi:Ser/Thr protein kinase RdoA (MazF antagonist)
MTPADPPRPPDAREAASVFALGPVLAEPVVAARGEMGRIWRLDTSAGRWALKEVFRPEPAAAELALVDVAFQEAALIAGVRLPRPRRAPDGRVLIQVGPEDDRRSVRVYSWVDLQERAAARVRATEAGAILGRLHGLALADDRPIHPWYRTAVPPGSWAALVARAADASAPWAATLERAAPVLIAGSEMAAGAFAPGVTRWTAGPQGPITCHLDFNPENVLVDVSGSVIVVDWENSGSELADQELASAVAEFVPDPAGTAAFLHAYEAAGGLARLRDRTSFAMTLTVQSALVRTYAERALDPTFTAEDRARSAHWIEDIAAQAFTLERIDRWLAAADRAGLLATA